MNNEKNNRIRGQSVRKRHQLIFNNKIPPSVQGLGRSIRIV